MAAIFPVVLFCVFVGVALSDLGVHVNDKSNDKPNGCLKKSLQKVDYKLLASHPWYPVAYTSFKALYGKCDTEINDYDEKTKTGSFSNSFVNKTSGSNEYVKHGVSYSETSCYPGMPQYVDTFTGTPTIRWQQFLEVKPGYYIAVRCGGNNPNLPASRLVISVGNRCFTNNTVSALIKRASQLGADVSNIQLVDQKGCPGDDINIVGGHDGILED